VTEHRYFGESLPYGSNASFSLHTEGCSGGMGLLNVEQALRDFVNVAASVRHTRCADCPVVAVGGSYPGLLAAMIRVRYPDQVQASWAASAPLGYLAGKVDPYGWFRIVTEAAAATHAQCPAAVRRMFVAIQQADAAVLAERIGLCDEGLSEMEFRQEVLALARTELATLAMSNYPPRTSALAAACSRIVDAEASADGGVAAARALLSKKAQQCRSVRAEWPAGRAASIECVDRTGCGGGRAGQAWDYMGCTWLRIPIATNNVTDMFPPMPWSEEWVSEYCARRFEAKPRPDLLPGRFDFMDPERLEKVASRIIFTNGLRDGWSAGGLLHSMGKDLPVLVMPNGAHHSETNLPSENDTKDVIEARRKVEAYLRAWLPPSDLSASRSVATTLMGNASVTLMAAAKTQLAQLGAALGLAAAVVTLLALAMRRAQAQTAEDSQGAHAPLLQSDLA